MVQHQEHPRTKEFIAGLLSSMVSISITFPITKLIYRQILENVSIGKALLGIRKEGIRRLYRGILPPLIERSVDISLMFGVYRTAELALHPLKLSIVDTMVASSIIAATAESVLTPFERTQLLLINSTFNNQFKNLGEALVVQIKHYGIKELYRGYTAILIRNICHNTFFFVAKAQIQHLTQCHKPKELGLQNFGIGASVGLMMTCLFYPLKVVKTNMQRQLGGNYKSLWLSTKEVYYTDRRSLKNFYRGWGMNVVRAVIGWGITNCSYEYIKNKLND